MDMLSVIKLLKPTKEQKFHFDVQRDFTNKSPKLK